jgi:Sulfate permease and related transporters (MFS superfamily)
VAAVFSMLLLIHRAAHPHVAWLGRVPATRRFSDFARHPDNEAVPGVLIVRVEASLLYFNVTHVRDRILRQVGSAVTGCAWSCGTCRHRPSSTSPARAC